MLGRRTAPSPHPPAKSCRFNRTTTFRHEPPATVASATAIGAVLASIALEWSARPPRDAIVAFMKPATTLDRPPPPPGFVVIGEKVRHGIYVRRDWRRSALLWGGFCRSAFCGSGLCRLRRARQMESVAIAQQGAGRKVEKMPDTSFSSFAPFWQKSDIISTSLLAGVLDHDLHGVWPR
jgi:hypothetical protein